jgi:hypothetical protein
MSPGHSRLANRTIFQHGSHKAPIQHNHAARVCTPRDASYRFKNSVFVDTFSEHIQPEFPIYFQHQKILQILETFHLWQQSVINPEVASASERSRLLKYVIGLTLKLIAHGISFQSQNIFKMNTKIVSQMITLSDFI